MMTELEAMEYIEGIARFGSHLGLDNIRTLMHYLGNPQKNLRFVHVAGTNGKGSTVSFLSHILTEAGYRTGVYTSPFIERFTERIRIGEDEISGEDLARLTEKVKNAVETMQKDGHGMPTEFEVVCAIAFLYFEEKKCDPCVLEVGLGGRLDATNVIDRPLLSVITTISYDHMEYLGSTLTEIAGEKAGIIKEGGEVLLYPQCEESEKVFEEVCREKNASLHHVRMPDRTLKADLDGVSFRIGERTYRIRLLGSYQTGNAATAVSAAEILNRKGIRIPEEAVVKGLEKTTWPGRFEVIRREPTVILDGSHNVEGMQKLAESLRLYFGDKKKIILIIGILKDKEYGKMLDMILPFAKEIYAVTPPTVRALSAGELADEILRRSGKNAEAAADPVVAYRKALNKAEKKDVIAVCGSLYYIGQIRSYEKIK